MFKNISNLSDEEYVRLNNIGDERILEWYDSHALLKEILDYIESNESYKGRKYKKEIEHIYNMVKHV